MEQCIFFDCALYAYLLAAIVYALCLVYKPRALEYGGTALLVAGLLAHTLFLFRRWLDISYPPLSSSFETLVWLSWIIVVQYLLVTAFFPLRFLGSVAATIAFLALAYSTLFPSAVRPLMPALQNSFWLTVHVILCVIGCVGFATSFAAALWHLRPRLFGTLPDRRNINEDNLAAFICQAIALGFPFLTMGIMVGSVWANKVWGRYWAWAPRETWSLITWSIYALYLVAHCVRSQRCDYQAWGSILGFFASVLAYLGTHFLF